MVQAGLVTLWCHLLSYGSSITLGDAYVHGMEGGGRSIFGSTFPSEKRGYVCKGDLKTQKLSPLSHMAPPSCKASKEMWVFAGWLYV